MDTQQLILNNILKSICPRPVGLGTVVCKCLCCGWLRGVKNKRHCVPGTGWVWFLYCDLINACLVDPVNSSVSQLTHQLRRKRKKNKIKSEWGKVYAGENFYGHTSKTGMKLKEPICGLCAFYFYELRFP